MTPIRALTVVVPARNEERRIDGCLRSLAAARHRLRSVARNPPPVRVIVVADRSTDRTAELAASWPGTKVVESDCGRVGGARSIGMADALAGFGAGAVSEIGPAEIWLAGTDADSRVPSDWLLTQVRLARQGADLLLGTVRPDPAELDPEGLLAWHRRHDLADGHRHVHGANLGVRGDVYLRAGGFADVAEHEDVLLVDAIRRMGGRVVSTGQSPVLTSARSSGRTPGGLAGYLRELLEETA